MNNEQLPLDKYRVTFRDLAMILTGAIALVTTGVIGLGIKAYNNALDPQRAEAVAKSMIDYKIPGGAEGKFGIKVAGVKVALVNSKTSPPDLELFIMKTPLNKETTSNDPEEKSTINITPTQSQEEFKVTSTRRQNLNLCGQNVNVKIEEGKQKLDNRPSPVFTVQYSATVTVSNEKLTAIVEAYGKNAKQNAINVFQSLKCK